MEQHEFIFAGFGGQGVLFTGQMLAYAAMDAGKHVTWIPSYGPEMRGGTANCTVILSDEEIGAPVVRHPGFAVVFNGPSFDKYEPVVKPGGLLVVNSTLIEHTSSRTDVEALYVPATEAAEKVGNIKLVNMVLLGATLGARPILPLEAIFSAMQRHLPESRHSMIEINRQALTRGAELAASLHAISK